MAILNDKDHKPHNSLSDMLTLDFHDLVQLVNNCQPMLVRFQGHYSMPLLVVCATLLDQRSIFSLLEDLSQADVTKLLSPSPSGSAVPPCIYAGPTSHTSQAQPTFGSISLFHRPRLGLDEKWPFNSRFGTSGDTGDPTNNATFLCALGPRLVLVGTAIHFN